VAQDPPAEPPPTPEAFALLQLDLLAQRFATLNAKLALLDREQRLLQYEQRELAADRASVQATLNQVFACAFDLDARACRPDPTAEE
jgi:hypothetical protein